MNQKPITARTAYITIAAMLIALIAPTKGQTLIPVRKERMKIMARRRKSVRLSEQWRGLKDASEKCQQVRMLGQLRSLKEALFVAGGRGGRSWGKVEEGWVGMSGSIAMVSTRWRKEEVVGG
jgi:hypothetical protein